MNIYKKILKSIAATLFAVFLCSNQAKSELLLIDFGTSGAGWYGGASVVGADLNGNYWNSVTSGTYYSNLLNTSGVQTQIGGFGFLTGITFGSYNGPAGATSNPLTQSQIDATVFTAGAGYFGVKEALVDYIKTSASVPRVKWVIDGLNSELLYTVKFYGSAKYQNDYATTLNVYSDNTFSSTSFLSSDTANYQNPTQSWIINTTDVGVIENLRTVNGSLYFEMLGTNGGSGLLNAFSIESSSAIPEPTSISLLFLGGAFILIKRRKL